MKADFHDLGVFNPFLNAAGFLGGDSLKEWPLPEPPGAWITPPLSLKARKPAADRCVLPVPGGFLLHSGMPTPSLSSYIKQAAPHWRKMPCPVWAHLLAGDAFETEKMVRMLEGVEDLTTIELSLREDMRGSEALTVVQAALGELPLVVEVSLNRAGEEWLEVLPGLGVAALSLGAPRIRVPAPNGGLVSGRMYGQGVLPLVLQALKTAAHVGLPLIASGGVYSQQDAETLLAAGATAVKLDAVLWRGFSQE
jgi:dihydroorotate dehydrogenase